MTELYANAYPKKRFFLDMFTRDIALEDCILDLIDNSIDSLVETRQIDLADASFVTSPKPANPPATIKVNFSVDHFTIKDNCGGIPLKEAQNGTFNFGRPAAGEESSEQTHLGAYGIGLKRAIFKLGRTLHLSSQTTDEGFTVDLDIDAWAKRDERLTDWRFPLKEIEAAGSAQKAGTTIKLTGLREEVQMRIDPGRQGDTVSRHNLQFHSQSKTCLAVAPLEKCYHRPRRGPERYPPASSTFLLPEQVLRASVR